MGGSRPALSLNRTKEAQRITSDKWLLAVYLYSELSSSRDCLGFFFFFLQISPFKKQKEGTFDDSSLLSEDLQCIGLMSLSG